MGYEVDHIFIMVSEDASEADLLTEFGLIEGAPNTHPGQGTACRRFFFSNMMLELVWVDDPAEAGSKKKQTFLWERWKNRHHCSPLGICLRPKEKWKEELPFKCWKYQPAYLPEGESFLISESSKNLDEPMLFINPFDIRADSNDSNFDNIHSLAFNKITSINLSIPINNPMSDALEYISGLKKITVKKSVNHSLEIGFDGEKAGKSINFKPRLPLILNW